MNTTPRRVSARSALAPAACAALLAALSAAVFADDAPAPQQPAASRAPYYRVATAPVETTLYATGERKVYDTDTTWRYMCGSDTTGKSAEDLKRIAAAHEADFADPSKVTVVDGPQRGAFNVVYNLGASVPPAAVVSFQIAEQYIEAHFNDNSSVTVSVSFANLGGGVIGSTGSNYVGAVTWDNTRAGLIAGMDGDDIIQNFLPSGGNIQVRYVGNSATVTNEDRCFFTRANFRAALGSVVGSDASMQYNSGFSFDFDPSNGVTGGTLSLVDTVIHETGHALGFTSAADFRPNDIEALDIFRFALNDGAGTDWNPDTLAEFQSTARCVSNNNINDDVQSDLITVEYRMSDGSPNQASHFREGLNGIMDPTLANGQTFFPNFYRTSDTDMFDAIGYDVVVICMAINDNPDAQQIEQGQTVFFNIGVGGQGPFTYKWRKDMVELQNVGAYTGVDTPQLRISPVAFSHEGVYDCVVINGCDTQTCQGAALDVIAGCPGDANGDHFVNFSDLNIVLGQFGQTGPGLPGDLNHDNVVNFLDLNLILSFFGTAC